MENEPSEPSETPAKQRRGPKGPRPIRQKTKGQIRAAAKRLVASLPEHATRIARFLKEIPSDAQQLLVVASGHVETVLLELSADDVVGRSAHELAVQIWESSRDYAESMDRECRFAARWLARERPVAQIVWRAGEGDLDVQLDGTLDSLLAQNQRHLETTHQMMYDLVQNQAGAWNKITAGLLGRIQQLEEERSRENRELERAKSAAKAALEAGSEGERQERLLKLAESVLGPLVQRALSDGLK